MTESKGISLAGNPVTDNTLCAIARAAVLTVKQRAPLLNPFGSLTSFWEFRKSGPEGTLVQLHELDLTVLDEVCFVSFIPQRGGCCPKSSRTATRQAKCGD